MIQKANFFSTPFYQFNGHLQTLFPSLFRKVNFDYNRKKVSTPDGDFLHVDSALGSNKNAIILSHGLEGSSRSVYIKGMAKAFHEKGYSVYAWNYRGCSGELNSTKRLYNAGVSDDLETVVNAVLREGYEAIYLIGFSLGGNVTLKYLGEQGSSINSVIKASINFSTPLDLYASSKVIDTPNNRIYAHNFLKSLKETIRKKATQFPEIDLTPLKTMKTLIEFDNNYTAPIHGYADAIDYYTKCSSIHFLKNIYIPTHIVNAANDPFLAPECYPTELLKDNPMVTLEIPKEGGHVGFQTKKGYYWSEKRALDFITHNESFEK